MGTFSDQPGRSDRLRLERRGDERAPTSGSVMAAFIDEDGAFTLTRVELVDSCDNGLGLLSPVPVDAGRRFTLYAGPVPLAHDSGVVARCAREGEAFRIGLRCDRQMAA